MDDSVWLYDQEFDDRYGKINALPTEVAREEALRLIATGSTSWFQASENFSSSPTPDPERIEWDLQDYSPLLVEFFSKYEEVATDGLHTIVALVGRRDAIRQSPDGQAYLFIGATEGGCEFLATPATPKIYYRGLDSPEVCPRFMASTIYHLILILGLPSEDEEL